MVLQSGFYDHQGLWKGNFCNKAHLLNYLFRVDVILFSVIYGNNIEEFDLVE